MRKAFGKIEAVKLGSGGYDDAMFGFSFKLSFDGGICTHRFWGTWSHPPSKDAKWTMQDQRWKWLESLLDVKKLMDDAKVDDFLKLVGKPIEVTIDGPGLGEVKDWRILTEVL